LGAWPLIIWEATTAKRKYYRPIKNWRGEARFGGLCPNIEPPLPAGPDGARPPNAMDDNIKLEPKWRLTFVFGAEAAISPGVRHAIFNPHPAVRWRHRARKSTTSAETTWTGK